jgi:hypothetical protein
VQLNIVKCPFLQANLRFLGLSDDRQVEFPEVALVHCRSNAVINVAFAR